MTAQDDGPLTPRAALAALGWPDAEDDAEALRRLDAGLARAERYVSLARERAAVGSRGTPRLPDAERHAARVRAAAGRVRR